jgi:hypothetical protein
MISGFVDQYNVTKKVVLYQLLYHCELMYDFLSETGKKIPDWISIDLAEVSLKTGKIKTEFESRKVDGILPPDIEFEIRTKIAETIAGDKEKLTKLFNKLTLLCAPASPCSLENTIPTHKLFFRAGPRFVRIIRDLWLISLSCLAGYILLSIFISLNSLEKQNIAGNILFQLQLVFSAGLGACFYSLNTAKKYVVARTFDNSYITHYYNSIIVGIIAGIILSNIINESFFSDRETGVLKQLTPSILALLGGYAADAVIRILNRLVTMLTTLVEGDSKSIAESREQELKNKLEAEKLSQTIATVKDLNTVLNTANLDDKVKEKLKEIIDSMLNPG